MSKQQIMYYMWNMPNYTNSTGSEEKEDSNEPQLFIWNGIVTARYDGAFEVDEVEKAICDIKAFDEESAKQICKSMFKRHIQDKWPTLVSIQVHKLRKYCEAIDKDKSPNLMD